MLKLISLFGLWSCLFHCVVVCWYELCMVRKVNMKLGLRVVVVKEMFTLMSDGAVS